LRIDCLDLLVQDLDPKSWLSKFNRISLIHLSILGLFYQAIGLIAGVALFIVLSKVPTYTEIYEPRSLISMVLAGPLEESVFFGIPFYATRNRFVVLGTGVAWAIFHLYNTQPQDFLTYNLAFSNFAFVFPHIFFSLRTWISGKGWFAIAFHLSWDLAVFSFLVLSGQNPWLIFSRDSYFYIEVWLLALTPILLLTTYWLYRRSFTKARTNYQV
jgi:hypothetical protein